MPWILSAIACLLNYKYSPASVSFHTSCCVLLGCSAGNGRKGSMKLRIRLRTCEKDSKSMQGVCGMQRQGIKVSQRKITSWRQSQKTPLCGYEYQLGYHIAPGLQLQLCLSVSSVISGALGSILNPAFPSWIMGLTTPITVCNLNDTYYRSYLQHFYKSFIYSLKQFAECLI